MISLVVIFCKFVAFNKTNPECLVRIKKPIATNKKTSIYLQRIWFFNRRKCLSKPSFLQTSWVSRFRIYNFHLCYDPAHLLNDFHGRVKSFARRLKFRRGLCHLVSVGRARAVLILFGTPKHQKYQTKHNYNNQNNQLVKDPPLEQHTLKRVLCNRFY